MNDGLFAILKCRAQQEDRRCWEWFIKICMRASSSGIFLTAVSIVKVKNGTMVALQKVVLSTGRFCFCGRD
jgi:hypothetical protein